VGRQYRQGRRGVFGKIRFHDYQYDQGTRDGGRRPVQVLFGRLVGIQGDLVMTLGAARGTLTTVATHTERHGRGQLEECHTRVQEGQDGRVQAGDQDRAVPLQDVTDNLNDATGVLGSIDAAFQDVTQQRLPFVLVGRRRLVLDDATDLRPRRVFETRLSRGCRSVDRRQDSSATRLPHGRAVGGGERRQFARKGAQGRLAGNLRRRAHVDEDDDVPVVAWRVGGECECALLSTPDLLF
jgi:hypothetical protein